jgi:D-3-phosphoglycerate dehydrogenase
VPLSLSKDKIRFLFLEGIHSTADEIMREAGYNNIERIDEAIDPESLIKIIGNFHFLGIRSRTQVTPQVLSAADKLVAVGCYCIGTDQVSLDHASINGIPVFNAPYANTRSVAELVLAEIIFLMRGLPTKNAAAHRGEWLKDAKGAYEVRGKTLGIIGYGHIGSQLGILAEGLGMRVEYFDIVSKLPLGNATPIKDLSTLLSRADVVSLHVPDTTDTENLMDAEMLSQMRRGAHLINASRGRVVDIDALHAALLSKQIGSVALDVFPSEPKHPGQRFESPLLGMDNVLITPHIGGSTVEAQQNIAKDVTEKLIRYSDNGSTVGAVNFPQVALPDHAGSRRILHIHRNEPGVLNAINTIISKASINIAAQYLQTQSDIGYVVMDVETTDTDALVEALGHIPATLKTRTLL